MGLMDRGEVIEQGAIEVEEDGAKTGHAGNIGGSGATEQGKFLGFDFADRPYNRPNAIRS